jgi:O-antigen ligase
MNFGRSLSALQTVAYPKIATFFAALISLITIRLAITSKNYLGGRERLLLAVLILFWGYTVIGNNFHGARISLQAILFPLTMFGLVLSSEYNQILRAIAFAGVLIMLICSCMLIVAPDTAFYNSAAFGVDKAILGSRLLAGPFSHPNALGAAMLIISPAFLILSKNRRILFLLCSFVTILMTGSRTSIYIFLFWVLVLMVPIHKAVKKRILLVGTLASLVLMFIIPFVVRQNDSFSNRGQIWIESRNYVFKSPIFGHGADFYSNELDRNSLLIKSALNGHNLMFDILIKYGLVGLVLLFAFFVIILLPVRSSSNFSVIQGSYLFLFFSSGITETHFSVTSMGELGFLFWVIFPIVILNRTKSQNLDKL